MENTIKVAVSLPKKQFRLVEQRRHLLKVSRSAAVREALSRWLQSFEEQQAVQQYLEGYRRRPETAQGWDAIERAQAEASVEPGAHETW